MVTCVFVQIARSSTLLLFTLPYYLYKVSLRSFYKIIIWHNHSPYNACLLTQVTRYTHVGTLCVIVDPPLSIKEFSVECNMPRNRECVAVVTF